MPDALIEFPRTLSAHPAIPQQPLLGILRSRIDLEPFNVIATVIFCSRYCIRSSRDGSRPHRIA
jgi:hypothetical protein